MIKISAYVAGLFILFRFQAAGQEDFTRHFLDGSVAIAKKHGYDSVEYLRYYDSNSRRLRDSIWILMGKGKQVPVGTSRHFYKNGQLSMLFHYDTDISQTILYREKLEYYRGGQLKLHIVKRGIDTIEYKSYHYNGVLKDSAWLCFPGGRELPIGTTRSYYKNGQLSEVVRHGSTRQEYDLIRYYKNGNPERIAHHPTGLTQFYARNGIQVREYDIHKEKDVYVPHQYRKRKYFSSTAFANKGIVRKALLCNNKKTKKLIARTWLALRLKKDTILLRHCLIEGFSRDSIYLSKLNYNPKFKTKNGGLIMILDSTFALAYNDIETLFYSRHMNKSRNFGAFITELVGLEVIIVPPIESLIFAASGNLEWSAVPIIIGSAAAIGVPMIYLGKYLFRTAVPRKYDLKNWKIEVNLK